MDDGTAFPLLGQTVSLIIDGRRVDGVMVTGLNLTHQKGSPPTGTIDLLLPTLVGEPDKRLRVRLDKVELAP
jgi:hypothetical protein